MDLARYTTTALIAYIYAMRKNGLYARQNAFTDL